MDHATLLEALVANIKTGCCGCTISGFRYGIQTALEAAGWHHTSIKALFDQAIAEANRQYEEERDGRL